MYKVNDTILFDLRKGGRILGCIYFVDNCEYQPYYTEVVASVGNNLNGSHVFVPFNELIIGRVIGNRIVNRGDGI